MPGQAEFGIEPLAEASELGRAAGIDATGKKWGKRCKWLEPFGCVTRGTG
ncbi:hypothetical protein [Streptomyces sp. GbtcB6]|nr:hypothetical protein [Streptomyces sp. GbtcB6]